MSKTKHTHVLISTITCAVPYDPGDLQEAAVIQQQLKSAAKAMVGFRKVEVKVGKVPTASIPDSATVPPVSHTAAMPAIPAQLRR